MEAPRGHPMTGQSTVAEVDDDFTSKIQTATYWRSLHASYLRAQNLRVAARRWNVHAGMNLLQETAGRQNMSFVRMPLPRSRASMMMHSGRRPCGGNRRARYAPRAAARPRDPARGSPAHQPQPLPSALAPWRRTTPDVPAQGRRGSGPPSRNGARSRPFRTGSRSQDGLHRIRWPWPPQQWHRRPDTPPRPGLAVPAPRRQRTHAASAHRRASERSEGLGRPPPGRCEWRSRRDWRSEAW